MKKMWANLRLLLIIPVVVASGIFLFMPGEDRYVWALYSLVSLLHVIVAIFYIIGLKAFKQEFRVGYWYLAAAMILYAVGLLELPLFKDIIDASEGAALTPIYYTAILPVLGGIVLYYVGLRKIASIIAVKSILLSPLFVAGVAVVVGLVVGFVTFITSTDPVPLSLATPLGVLAAVMVCVLASAVLLFRLHRGVSALYRPAFAWNFYGFLALFLGQVLDPTPFLPSDHWYIDYSLAVPLLPSALCFLKAAFEFNRIPYKEGVLMEPVESGQQKTSIDIILAIAQLVSNPVTIDPELDTLRSITAKRGTGMQLTPQQQVQLADLYYRLETFLVHKEPTRDYTVPALRQMVDIRFHGSVNEPAFWQRFQALPRDPAEPVHS